LIKQLSGDNCNRLDQHQVETLKKKSIEVVVFATYGAGHGEICNFHYVAYTKRRTWNFVSF
jgi:hypothetical protein